MIMKRKDYPNSKLRRTNFKEGILRADGWTSECPYKQTVSVEGISYGDTVDLLLDEDLGREEYTAFERALIVSETQGMNSITVKAYGMKPVIDLPFLAAIETIQESCKAGA